ncbi:MAG: 30S ribosomal protein S7 [Candidatus Bostrichicola ureolyticus]|nr:MAG: 30S ribosomal protein S7 [Candidatus Bostrichicola ureolyticus]
MRKVKALKKSYLPDPKYGDTLVTRFVNHLIKDGKKIKAFNIFYNAIKKIDEDKKTEEKTGLDIWKQALKNVMPHVEVRSRRIGGVNIQIPVTISSHMKITKAIKLIIKCASLRNEKSMAFKLACEILDAFNEEGMAIKKRDNIHKIVEANKAFSHFRF